MTGFANYVYGVTFDPTGRYLAAGSTDRTVRIWDLTNPDEAVPVGAELRGPGDTVYAVSWTGDGAVLAGASKDGAVWLWDVTDPAAPLLQSTLTAAEGNLYAVALGPPAPKSQPAAPHRVWSPGRSTRTPSRRPPAPGPARP